jgi:hypothetical protein
MNILTEIYSSNIIWTRAQFDCPPNKSMQMNQWVKLTIEIFTKLNGDGVDV